MKVITNEAIVAKRKKWANILAPIAMLLLLGGLGTNLLSLRSEQIDPLYFYATLLLLLLGFIASTVSSSLVNRWVREPRADQILGKTLRGFDNRHILFNYTTPFPHVLVAQNKVYAIITRPQKGHIRVTNTKWKRDFSLSRVLRFFADESLGNPTIEAQLNAGKLAKYLQQALPEETEVPIEPVILFTHPEVQLTVNGSDVTAMKAGNFKAYLRKSTRGAALGAQLRQQLTQILSNRPA
ncbi:MAG: hypothetical protein ACE5G8_14005 [Anaerolineae bacterium]